MSAVLAFILMFGGGIGVAVVLYFGLRAIKLI